MSSNLQLHVISSSGECYIYIIVTDIALHISNYCVYCIEDQNLTYNMLAWNILVICRYTNLHKWRPLSLGSKVHVYIGYIRIHFIIAYQNKNHTFNWLNALHVTFTIPRNRLECWYRPVQKPCIDWYYWSIHRYT
jgi:hypothetical protein